VRCYYSALLNAISIFVKKAPVKQLYTKERNPNIFPITFAFIKLFFFVHFVQ